MGGEASRGASRAAPAVQRRAASSPRADRSGPDAESLHRLLEPVVGALGMDLEEVRITTAGRRRLLRVIVDADGGVSLDDIADASREVCARLDAGDALGQGPYTVEVSSPGVDRPLTQPRHWRRAVGRLVAAPVAAVPGAAGPAALIEGRVTSADEQGVTIDVDGAQRDYGYAELGPGRVQIEFGRLDALRDEEELDGH